MIYLEILSHTYVKEQFFFSRFTTEYKSSICDSLSVSKFKMFYSTRDILALSFLLFF